LDDIRRNNLGARIHSTERGFFIDNLLVRVHVIIEIILVDRPYAMGISIPIFQVS